MRSRPRKEPPDERRRRAPFPRSDRHPQRRPAGNDRDRRAHQAEAQERGREGAPPAGRTLAMIFERPSTRTRVSFEVAMRQLGGDAIMLTADEMQLGRGETIGDTARVLSRYVDVIMIRTLDHEAVAELARHATLPVS